MPFQVIPLPCASYRKKNAYILFTRNKSKRLTLANAATFQGSHHYALNEAIQANVGLDNRVPIHTFESSV